MYWALSLVFGKVALEGNNTFTIVVLHFGVLGIVVMERGDIQRKYHFHFLSLALGMGIGKGQLSRCCN